MRKNIFGLFFGFLLVSLAVFPADAATVDLFTDDFEDTTLDAWDAGFDPAWSNASRNAHSGSRKARISGNVENAALSKTVSTEGYTQLELSFWYDSSSSWQHNDSTEVQWSTDGTSWQSLRLLDEDDATPLVEGGEEWGEVSQALPAGAEEQDTLMFRFLATIKETAPPGCAACG